MLVGDQCESEVDFGGEAEQRVGAAAAVDGVPRVAFAVEGVVAQEDVGVRSAQERVVDGTAE